MADRKRASKAEKERQRVSLNRRPLQKSSVRPFFCCGSQVSLNSIPDVKELPAVKEQLTDDDYEDLTDSDEAIDEFKSLNSASSLTVHSIGKAEKRSTRLSNGRYKKSSLQQEKNVRRKFWTLKLRGKLQVTKPSQSHYASESDLDSPKTERDMCICTSFKPKSDDDLSQTLGATAGSISNELVGIVPVQVLTQIVSGPATENTVSLPSGRQNGARPRSRRSSGRRDQPLPFVVNLNELYPINDIDDQLIAQRRLEMEQGIEVAEDVWVQQVDKNLSVTDEPSASVASAKDFDSLASSTASIVCSNTTSVKKPVGQYPSYGAMALLSSQARFQQQNPHADQDCHSQHQQPQQQHQQQHSIPSFENSSLTCSHLSLNTSPWVPNLVGSRAPSVHTQVDYMHYLVPRLDDIVNSSFYWGVMDRYQAEKLMENKPEGTFLLRDSAQDEFLFSVSFRRYGRSLHARIEQWNHKFSFDSRDPGVFATDTVCDLIAHYKDPSACLFFEPMLTLPLHRTFPFSLQHLTRAAICSRLTYDGINQLTLPNSLKEYLKMYHYKQKVRVRRFDVS